MATMYEKVVAAARKAHPACEVLVAHGIVEVALPEDCGRIWWVTGGTMLVADAARFGSLAAALKETLADIRIGTTSSQQVAGTGKA